MVKVVNFMLYYVTLTQFSQKVVNEAPEGTKNTDFTDLVQKSH